MASVIRRAARKIKVILTPEDKRHYSKRELHIRAVMKKTGWSRKKTVSVMTEASEKLGITFRDYDVNGMALLSDREQAELAETIVNNRKKAIEKKKQTARMRADRHVEDVARNSGMTKEEALEKMTACRAATGMSFEHYSKYHFWNIPEEEQGLYFTKGMADALKLKYNRFYDIRNIIFHKNLFLKEFDEYLGRPWIFTENIDKEQFKNKFDGEEKLIFKPESSAGGKGIRVFDLNEDSIDEVYDKITNLGPGVVEGFIKQHPEVSKLSTRAVNTVRIVTIFTRRKADGIETGVPHFVYAGFRMGSGDSYVDNIHSGGLVAAVDIDTGEVMSDAVDFAYKVYDHHPETGHKIRGFRIPYFQEAKEMLGKAILEKNMLGYYGWDIAVTENGPVIVECNTHPGAGILQAPFIHQRKGMKYVIEKYLGDAEYQYRGDDDEGNEASDL